MLAGAVIAVRSHWDCNLDANPKHCNMQPFMFLRVDDQGAAFSQGIYHRLAM